MLKRFLTVKEVCEWLNLSRTTVDRMTKAGTIPAHRFGGSWRYEQGELEQWAATQRGGVDAK